jgi:hypothetical protein
MTEINGMAQIEQECFNGNDDIMLCPHFVKRFFINRDLMIKEKNNFGSQGTTKI